MVSYTRQGSRVGRNLVGDVWASFTDVTSHLPHNANVLVTVQEGVFLIFGTRFGAMGCAVGLETGVGQDNDESLGVLVSGGDWNMLFGNEPRKFRGRERLGS